MSWASVNIPRASIFSPYTVKRDSSLSVSLSHATVTLLRLTLERNSVTEKRDNILGKV